MNGGAGVKRLVDKTLTKCGYRFVRITRPDQLSVTHPDLERNFARLYEACAAYTATSAERMYALWSAVHHVHRQGVPGDMVECGVWRGGSSMLAAMTLDDLDCRDRSVFLFDTFAGMSEPSERDGPSLLRHWEQIRGNKEEPVFAYASLDEVRANMTRTGFDRERIVFVQGKVEDTVPASAPAKIAVLRLDTDWYESTRHELEQLWPRLQPGGVLIIDDYGHYVGAREAVDEFFDGRSDAPLLSRIDYTGRIAVKRL